MAIYKELKSLTEFDFFKGDFESIKDFISMRLFNKKNLPLDKSLDLIPHSDYADLAITFSVEKKDFFDKQKGVYCYMLTNEDIEVLNVNKDILTKIANENIVNKNAVRIESIQEHITRSHVFNSLTRLPDEMAFMMEGPKKKSNSIFKGSMPLPLLNNQDKTDVLLVSNRTQTFAAVNFVFNDTLERLCEKFKENFYMVPISVHELICIRETYATRDGDLTTKETIEELADMVEQVNDTLTHDTADILSYNIYYHSCDDRCTMIVT